MPKRKRLLPTTVVYPNEYDLDKDIDQLIDIANKDMQYVIPMDVGKVVGLYYAYKELEEQDHEQNN